MKQEFFDIEQIKKEGKSEDLESKDLMDFLFGKAIENHFSLENWNNDKECCSFLMKSITIGDYFTEFLNFLKKEKLPIYLQCNMFVGNVAFKKEIKEKTIDYTVQILFGDCQFYLDENKFKKLKLYKILNESNNFKITIGKIYK